LNRVQNYENHVHLPKLWVAGTVLWLIAVVAAVMSWFGFRALWVAQLAGLLALGVALTIGRVYITALQDRIIKTEMRLRCGRFLSDAQMAQLFGLSTKHIVALRFASDAELPALLERAVRDGLTADAIKRAVKDWVPDWDRT